MNANEKIELAKAYVALSNAHQLALIFPLFSEHASYESPHVGVFDGKAAISQMMTGFFAQFPDVHWQVEEYICLDDGGVQFHFTRTGTDLQTQEKVARQGVEVIQWTLDGLISSIKVG